MLGWELKREGGYKIKLPFLSKEEKRIILKIEEHFRDIARIKEFRNENEIKEEIELIIKRIAEEEMLLIEKEQKEYLVELSLKHIYGLGAFEELLNDENIEEIAVIGLNKPVYIYYKTKGWLKTNLFIEDEEFLIELINKMASTIGRRITLKNPRIDAILKDGSRLHASIPPISEGELTIRKFRSIPLSPKEIVEFKTIDYKTMAILSLFMQSDSSIVISGNTASGKTTTLNSLFSFVPENERILIIEETPEINIPHKHKIRLVSNIERGIKLEDLVYDSLRMRPDRIIVGEIRNKEEARALIDVLLAGQARGAYATFHAKSGEEFINRMKSYGADKYELKSIDLVVVQKRIGIYKNKKVVEKRVVVEISSPDEDKSKKLMEYNYKDNKWKWGKEVIKMLEEKLILSEKEVKDEIKKRVNFLKNAEKEFSGFFEAWQKSWLRG